MPLGYSPTIEYKELIERAFVYHAPKPDQLPRYTEIRSKAREFAELLTVDCPQSAELTLAIRHIQEAVAFANMAIAVNES